MDSKRVEELAREACAWGPDENDPCWEMTRDELHKFAELIRADAAREAAKIALDTVDPEWPNDDLSQQAEGIGYGILAHFGIDPAKPAG